MSMTLMRQLPAGQGLALSNRYKMRRFKNDEDAYEFLAKGDIHSDKTSNDVANAMADKRRIDMLKRKDEGDERGEG